MDKSLLVKKAAGKKPAAFLLIQRNNTLQPVSIFSKQAVKTYPQAKIKLCGIAFERLDGLILAMK